MILNVSTVVHALLVNTKNQGVSVTRDTKVNDARTN